jgi:hypothetical protein
MANVKLSQLPALASPTDTTSIPVVDGGVTKKITGLSLATYVNGKNTAYTLPTASTSTLGGVKVDGSSVTINNGIISVSTGLTGSVVFKGTWNANTNTPTLVNGTGTSGWMYIVGTAGTQNLGGGTVTYNASDLIVYDGTNWIDIAANNGVVSFNTRTGAVTLTSTDVTAALGFTPYDATNPNSYLTTITSSQVTGALGYTPIQTTSLSVTASPANVNSSLSYNSGVFTFTPYSLPSATTTSLGGVKIDNSTITINNDVISVSSALTNAVQFKGGWDASTNTPALGAGLPAGVAAGWEYIVSAAGTQNIGSGSIAYAVNDLVIYNGSSWIRIPGSTSVVSFNTRQGAITLTNTDVTTALGGTQNANKVLAGPSTGADASPTFRALTALDLPTTITPTNVLVGSQANLTRFPNALAVISNTILGIQQNESHNIGLMAEGTANSSNTAIWGVGVYGVGYTNSGTRSGGVVGEGHVSASADVGSAIGVRGYANDTHSGGLNIGLYGDATNGSSNYALYLNSGGIYTAGALTWTLNGNLSFSGAYTVGFTAATATSSSTAASVGYQGMPQQSKSSAYTTVIGDAGKHIYVTATATITIDSNANVAYPIGTAIAFIAASGATVTIAITSDTMYLGGTGTTGSRTLAAFGMATAVKVTSTSWFINGTGLT